jgi:lipopolysaccharide transport system ATP-binding protein
LAKRYALGPRSSSTYRTLRETLGETMHSVWRRWRRGAMRNEGSTASDTIWALRDVSFEVQPGEVVGIIGHNGAGKSTLLKLLSRVTEPTAGRIDLRGRIGSLLEVGTGFHPELTGRENVHLSGAILGMSRREINRKFDAIVSFAEVERFLDLPVKRYSSGMYVRLAFAVAAHLDPEILIVDEVLAVGDAAFQSKCLGKIGSVASSGRTVLLVSHTLASIQALCPKALLLRSGRVERYGAAADVIQSYLSAIPRGELVRVDREHNRNQVAITGIRVSSTGRGPDNGLTVGQDALFELEYHNPLREPIRDVEITVGIYDIVGGAVTYLANRSLDTAVVLQLGSGVFGCRLPRVPFAPGEYLINVDVYQYGKLLDRLERACRFTVHEGDYYGTGKLPYSRLGTVFLDHSWE